MNINFCFVSATEAKNGVNLGSTFVYKNKSKWVQNNNFDSQLACGWTKGMDFVHYNGKTYQIYKTFIDIDENNVIYLCVESVMGCDT